MRFLLLVEGYTEHAAVGDFLKRWLDPRLQKPVTVQTKRHDGWQHLCKDARKFAGLALNEPRRGEDIIAVLVLLDLYGPIYPGGLTTAAQRQEWLRKKIRDGWNEPRFLVYCAVHETEAWLLSQPEIFPPEVRKLVQGKCARPEEVDHDEPPAKLLNRCYESKLHVGYKKVTDGKTLFGKLDPEVAAQKCPNLREMLEALQQKAHERGL